MEFRRGLSSFIRGLAARIRKESAPTDTTALIMTDAAKLLQEARTKQRNAIEERIRSGQTLRKHESRLLKRFRAQEARDRRSVIITLPTSKRRYIVDKHGAWRRIVEPGEEHSAKRGVVRRAGKWYKVASFTPTTTLQ